MMRIFKTTNTLSDGSKVYDVAIIYADQEGVTIPAVTERDADLLVCKLADAIEAHAVQEVEV